MNINRDNYESYFIDYLDGSLTPEQVGEVRAFLLLNEDLAEMLEDTDQVKLQIPHVKYSGKAALRKDELHACPDYYAIAAAENALTKEDIKLASKSNDSLLTDNIYFKLKLKPDTGILYPHKKRLYRKQRPFVYLRIAAAAACVLFLGTGYFFLNRQADTAGMSLAQTIVIPPMVPVDVIEINDFIKPTESNTSIPNKRVKHAVEKTEPQTVRESIAIMEPLYAAETRLALPENNYHLITNHHYVTSASQPEIHLAKSASEWKASNNLIQSDNIVASVIQAGRIIAEKIRNLDRVE